MKIVHLEQRTQAWYDWRSGKDLDGYPQITASMVAAIMGTSPWQSPHDLWLELTGRVEPKAATWVMNEGIRKEPMAREILCRRTGT